MEKIRDKLQNNFWARAISYGLPFGLVMASQNDNPIAGLMSGLVFGLIMAKIRTNPEKAKLENDDGYTIVVKYPLSISYFMIGGAGFFVGILLMSVVAKDISQNEKLFYGAFFSTFALGCLSLPYYLSTVTFIGKSMILTRTKFGPFSKKRKYLFRNFKESKISSWGSVNFIFRDGSKIGFHHQQSPAFLNLPEYKGELKNRNLEPLYRLKQEIDLRRLNLAQKIEREEEIKYLENPINKFSIAHLIVAFLLGLSLIGYIEAKSYLQYREKISSNKNPQNLRFYEFEKAFKLYNGALYNKMKDQWKEECQEKSNYSCRLSAYFFMIEGDNKTALSYIERSCSESDPHSCYDLLKSDLASNELKSKANSVLEDVCSQNEITEQACCDCYQQLKSKRVPASPK